MTVERLNSKSLWTTKLKAKYHPKKASIPWDLCVFLETLGGIKIKYV